MFEDLSLENGLADCERAKLFVALEDLDSVGKARLESVCGGESVVYEVTD